MKRFNCDFASRFRILKGGKISLVVSALLGSTIIANATPIDGVVTSGNASISQSGNVTNINQSTQKATINWQNFDIDSNETVNFNQPNVDSITLNRVIGNEKTVINGALNANGQVWILNSNGVLFNKDAKINTSGLVASTASLSDKDFQDGNYDFKNSTANSVINLGTIEVANNGAVVLASNEVKNSGTIKAVRGKVYLTGADEYTINLNGNSIVNLVVTKGVLDAMVENSGSIQANAGEIYLTTNAVNELLKGVVNNTGVVEANSLDDITGKVEIFAHGGTANVSGEIKAEKGFVETSGKNVKVAENTKIKAKTWLLDPTNITIASNGSEPISGTPATTSTAGDVTISASTINTQLNNGTNVLLQADNNISVNQSISKTNGVEATLTLKAGNSITIANNVNISSSNDKLNLVLWADSDATNGGFVKLSQTTTNFDQIKTNGGNLWIGGGSGTTTWNGLTVGDGYAKSTSTYATGVFLGKGNILTNGGNIAIYGETSASANTYQPTGDNAHSGVYTQTSTINSGTGTILIYGKNSSANTYNNVYESIYINGGSITSSATTGDAITLHGDSSGATSASSRATGVTIHGWSNNSANILANGGGNIKIYGKATPSGTNQINYGVRITNQNSSTSISTLNGGNVSIEGISGNYGALAVGVETATDIISSSGDLSITGENKPITIQSAITVAKKTSLNANGQDISLLSSNNNFTEEVNISANNINLNNSGELLLGSVVSNGILQLNSTGNVGQTQNSTLTINGASTFNVGNKDINFTNSSNTFNSLNLTGNNISIQSSLGLLLDQISSLGNLYAKTLNGDITQTNNSILNLQGLSNFDVGNNNLILQSSNNNLNNLNFIGKNFTLSNSGNLQLGNIISTGDFNMINNGNITQSINSNLTFTGNTTFDVQNNNIILTNTNNSFNKLNINANIVGMYTGAGTLQFGNITSNGNFDITSNGGIIQLTDSILTFNGNSTFNAGNNDIIFANANNTFNSLNLTGNNISVTSKLGLILDKISSIGDFNATALNGNITQTAESILEVIKSSSFNTQDKLVALNSLQNKLNAISIQAKDIDLKNSQDLYLNNINSNGTLNIKTLNGDILQTTNSTLNLIGTSSFDAENKKIILANENNNFNIVNLKGEDIKIKDSTDGLIFNDVITKILSVTSLDGDITQTNDSVLNINESSTFDSGNNDIILKNSNNDFNVLNLLGNNISFADKTDVVLGDVTSNGLLDISNKGNLSQTQDSTLTINQDLIFNTGVNNIKLLNTNNEFKKELNIKSYKLELFDINNLILGDVEIDNDLNIIADTGIQQSQDSTFISKGVATFDVKDGDINLSNDNNDFSQICLFGKNISFSDSVGGVILGDISSTGNVEVVSKDGDITQALGTVLKIEGETSLDAEDSDIKIGNKKNFLKGTVNVNALSANIETQNVPKFGKIEVSTPIKNEKVEEMLFIDKIIPKSFDNNFNKPIFVESFKPVEIKPTKLSSNLSTIKEIKNADSNSFQVVLNQLPFNFVNGGVKLPVGVEQLYMQEIDYTKNKGAN